MNPGWDAKYLAISNIPLTRGTVADAAISRAYGLQNQA